MFCSSCVVVVDVCAHSPILATSLNIETSYLVQICTYIPHFILFGMGGGCSEWLVFGIWGGMQ